MSLLWDRGRLRPWQQAAAPILSPPAAGGRRETAAWAREPCLVSPLPPPCPAARMGRAGQQGPGRAGAGAGGRPPSLSQQRGGVKEKTKGRREEGAEEGGAEGNDTGCGGSSSRARSGVTACGSLRGAAPSPPCRRPARPGPRDPHLSRLQSPRAHGLECGAEPSRVGPGRPAAALPRPGPRGTRVRGGAGATCSDTALWSLVQPPRACLGRACPAGPPACACPTGCACPCVCVSRRRRALRPGRAAELRVAGTACVPRNVRVRGPRSPLPLRGGVRGLSGSVSGALEPPVSAGASLPLCVRVSQRVRARVTRCVCVCARACVSVSARVQVTRSVCVRLLRSVYMCVRAPHGLRVHVSHSVCVCHCVCTSVRVTRRCVCKSNTDCVPASQTERARVCTCDTEHMRGLSHRACAPVSPRAPRAPAMTRAGPGSVRRLFLFQIYTHTERRRPRPGQPGRAEPG